MDSPASSRGRNRSTARKRHSLPARSSSQHLSESVEQPSNNTPAAAAAAAATEMHSSSFTFETPSPSHQRDTRKRARQVDGVDPSQDDAESKGGRSLRKRTRVDYSFDQLDSDETFGPKPTPTTSRSTKKRKSDAAVSHDDDVEKEAEARVKRRASEQPQSAPRRRGPAKRSTIGVLPAYVADPQLDDVEVQDTIEVGGHHSSHSEESPQRRSSSSSSHEGPNSSQQNAAGDTVVVRGTLKDAVPSTNEVSTNDTPGRKASLLEPNILEPNMLEEILPELEPADATSSQETIDPLEHLTPYIEGATVLYPTIQSDLDPEPDPETDAGQDDAAQQEDAAEDTGYAADATEAGEATEAAEATEAGEVAEEETPAATPRASGTRANSPAPDSDAADIAPPPVQRQHPFQQIRPVSEFTDLFKDIKSLPPAELYRRLEVANGALVAWQGEYREIKKITDDEDNAQRYRQEESAFQHRVKMAISKDPDANPVQKDFVVKGVRAPKPDPESAYAKQQDKIMSNAYLFDYDDRESKIGQQDPIAQRAGFGKGRLRDRPKPTAKAAEADDPNVVTGKRTRKPPVLFDGGEAASRGSTPAPAAAAAAAAAPGRRRGRRGGKDEENGDAQPAPPSSQPAAPTPQSSQNQPAEQETPKKKGKGGRPRKNPLPAPIPEEQPAPSAREPEPEPQPVTPVAGEKRTRKRRRKAQDDAEESATVNGTAKAEAATPKRPPRTRRNSSRTTAEIPSGSFYTTSSMASTTNTAPEDQHSRPQTASSTATVDTVISNYQLREKRRTNFSSFNTDYDDHQQQQQPPAAEEEKTPRPKRVRRAPKKIQSEDFAPFHESMPTLAPAPLAPPPPPPSTTTTTTAPAVQLPDPPAPVVAKPPTRIKIKNYHPPAPVSAPTSVPSSEPPSSQPPSSDATPPFSTNGNGNGNGNGAEGDNGDAPKDYNTMTKSEKMSFSMKARWASGSMNPAVVKRRATLAAKKQATTKPLAPGQAPDAGPLGQ